MSFSFPFVRSTKIVLFPFLRSVCAVGSYLSYQMKKELYYVSTAAARRSDTSA